MTISSTTRKAGPFNGNGIVTAFPFAFKVFSANDLKVVRAVAATEAETPLTLNTDYTATLNADQETSPGGVVTTVAALASGLTVTLSSQVPNLQSTALTDGGPFRAESIMVALDRSVVMIQQLQEQVDRSFKIPFSSGSTPGEDLQNYVSLAKGHATASGNSSVAAAASATLAGASATRSANSATAAANSAAAAVAPTESAMAAYFDRYYPLDSLSELSVVYNPVGFDFGDLLASAGFPNESQITRVTLSKGSMSYDYSVL